MDNPTPPMAEAPALPPEPVAAHYVGKGAYWPGVPARDLTLNEWAALDLELRTAVLAAGLYIEEA